MQYHRQEQTLNVGDRVADYQPSLLSNQELKAAEVSWAYNRPTPQQTALTAAELTAWKQRVQAFQQTVKTSVGATQGSLFGGHDTSPTDDIDPFTLPQRNAEFWREQFTDVGNAALYFVVDHEADLLLYVGETVKANQRWKGTHDCKRYILNYVSAHRTAQLPVQVNIGFWPYAPADRKARQALESDLIRKWRSPFNKENWRPWATPFIGHHTDA
ncbi:MAG: GIY-YIG nuclease family protein [Cyanobacteria bacterium P01_D01_bin.6]